VAPFFSIIRNYAKRGLLKNKKIHLFYSNKTKKDIAFFDELNSISDKNKNQRIFYYLTRQKIKDGRIKEFKRIDAESIKDKLGYLENKDYFICGSMDFVSDMKRIILGRGVDEHNIHTELFY
jgi:ferredoxin-NADP reductase